jgi:hypothetical protein
MAKNKSVIFLKLLNFSSMEDFIFLILYWQIFTIVTFFVFQIGENLIVFWDF